MSTYLKYNTWLLEMFSPGNPIIQMQLIFELFQVILEIILYFIPLNVIFSKN